MHIFRPFATLLVALLLLAPSTPANAGIDINVGGTTNLAPLLMKLAADYENTHPGVTISIGSTNTGAGIASLKKHDIDIAMSDVAIDRKIVLIGRDIGTGTRFVFENKVAKTLTPVHVVADETDVLKGVAQTSGALGYLASGFLADRDDLVVTYQGVAPTPAAIHANGYGFSTDEHLYTQKNPSPEVSAFVQYVKNSTSQLVASGIY